MKRADAPCLGGLFAVVRATRQNSLRAPLISLGHFSFFFFFSLVYQSVRFRNYFYAPSSKLCPACDDACVPRANPRPSIMRSKLFIDESFLLSDYRTHTSNRLFIGTTYPQIYAEYRKIAWYVTSLVIGNADALKRPAKENTCFELNLIVYRFQSPTHRWSLQIYVSQCWNLRSFYCIHVLLFNIIWELLKRNVRYL